MTVIVLLRDNPKAAFLPQRFCWPEVFIKYIRLSQKLATGDCLPSSDKGDNPDLNLPVVLALFINCSFILRPLQKTLRRLKEETCYLNLRL